MHRSISAFAFKKSWLSKAQWIAVFAFFTAFPGYAQVAPGDSLIGKTIHVFIQDTDFNHIYFDNADKTRGLFQLEAPYTYSITLTDAIVSNKGQQDFLIRSDGAYTNEDYKYKLSPSGLSTAPRIEKFPTSVFAGHSDIWIIVDPTKPQYDTPPVILFEAPKRIHLLNPWPVTGPKIVSAAGTRTLSTGSNCGWFWTLLLDPAMYKLHFAEINDVVGETYGQGGFGSTVDFDLTPEFEKNGDEIWLNTQTNVWSKTKPPVDGECQYQMAATVRDFSKEHPDFDFGSLTGDHSVLGVVQNTIGPNRKPVGVPSSFNKDQAISFSQFDKWWVTDSTNADAKLRNYESCVDIPMSKSSDGAWEYDSYRDGVGRSFFPIPLSQDHTPSEQFNLCYLKPGTTNWVTTGQQGSSGIKADGNFCMESHASFIYQKGQQFAFRGDDDVWVFINDKLVVDLGGVHIPKSDSVDLDKLGLTPGKEYKWDLFYCDRQPCGSSLRIKTSIYFRQQRALDTIITKTANSTTVEIIKREGGLGSCASTGTDVKIVPPSNLIFQLLDGTGKVLDTLGNGTFYEGIIIAAPKVTVNVDDIRSLSPGRYTIISYEAANASLKVAIPFIVPSRNFVEADPPYQVDSLVTAVIPVVLANRDATVLVPKAEPYVLVFSGNAQVFADKALTQPLATDASRTTQATGYDTVWVSGNPAITTDQTLSIQSKGSSKVVQISLKQPPPIVVELQPPYQITVPVTSVVAVPLQAKQKGIPLAEATPYKLGVNPTAKVFSDAAMATALPVDGSLITDADGKDTVWVVGDPAAFNDQVITLSTPGTNQKVIITFQLPPIVLPKALSAGVYDDDGNGIADRITVTFDSNLAVSTPKQVSYVWPTGANAVSLTGAEVKANLDPTGMTLTLGNLALTKDILTKGDGIWTTTFFVRGKDTSMSVVLTDKIPPILLKAEAKQGETDQAADTLELTFSEPVNSPTASASELFEYRAGTDTANKIFFTPVSFSMTNGNTTAILIFAKGVPSPQPGRHSVRITSGAGHITDAAGNGVGPESRFRLITGVKKTGIQSWTLLEGDLSPQLAHEPAVKIILTVPDATAEAISKQTGRLGHLLKIDLGDYAVEDDFTSIKPEQVHMKWSVVYYDNMGNFVNRDGGDLSCTDALFMNDCTKAESRGNLFIGWSLYTKDGSQAATGAYISRLQFKVWAGDAVVAENKRDERWGYVRKH